MSSFRARDTGLLMKLNDGGGNEWNDAVFVSNGLTQATPRCNRWSIGPVWRSIVRGMRVRFSDVRIVALEKIR